MRIENATWSVCPRCGTTIEAVRVQKEDGSVLLSKRCPVHGDYQDILWRGRIDHGDWIRDHHSVRSNRDCGHCKGLCTEHERQTCCVLLEITDRCNLNCRFCFADPTGKKDPSQAQIRSWIFDLAEEGKTYLQLSGGEPTMRDDLPEIIAFAKKSGCRYVQLNSNGIRLAQDREYTKKLARAGLDFVFLQFDGIHEEIYRHLRGRDLLAIKEQAIEACGEAGIGVTLVPTIVPSVNEDQLGDILRFAIRHSPVVRGVHYQPVSYFGRLPHIPEWEQRYTLDQLVSDLIQQSGGMLDPDSLLPSACDHPMCGFHGAFAVMPDQSLYPVTKRKRKTPCSSKSDPAARNREFIGSRWAARPEQTEETVDMQDMDSFLRRVRGFGFTITAMAFQDAGNLDFERLRSCSLHVYRRGRKIPFCAAYLSDWSET